MRDLEGPLAGDSPDRRDDASRTGDDDLSTVIESCIRRSFLSPNAGSTMPHHCRGHSGFPGGKSSGKIGILGWMTMAPFWSTSKKS